MREGGEDGDRRMGSFDSKLFTAFSYSDPIFRMADPLGRGIFVVFVAFSLLLGPFMWLYNRITDKNRSNVISRNEFVIGELTEKIVGDTIGEVMEIGSQSARSVYPARFFGKKIVKTMFDCQSAPKSSLSILIKKGSRWWLKVKIL